VPWEPEGKKKPSMRMILIIFVKEGANEGRTEEGDDRLRDFTLEEGYGT